MSKNNGSAVNYFHNKTGLTKYLHLSKKDMIAGCDNLIGGYLENVPENAE